MILDSFWDSIKLIALCWIIEFKLSSRLIKTWFKSEFWNQVFELSQNFDIKYLNWIMMLISSIDSNFWFNSSKYDLLLLTCWMIMQQSNAIDSITSSWLMKIIATINRNFLISINCDSWKYWLLLVKIFSRVLIMTHENTDYY